MRHHPVLEQQSRLDAPYSLDNAVGATDDGVVMHANCRLQKPEGPHQWPSPTVATQRPIPDADLFSEATTRSCISCIISLV